MNVCAQDLWHPGSVTAACLAKAGHYVIGLDYEAATQLREQDLKEVLAAMERPLSRRESVLAKQIGMPSTVRWERRAVTELADLVATYDDANRVRTSQHR